MATVRRGVECRRGIPGCARGLAGEYDRATAATRLREAGMALEAVQAQAGHRSIESTRIYLQVAAHRGDQTAGAQLPRRQSSKGPEDHPHILGYQDPHGRPPQRSSGVGEAWTAIMMSAAKCLVDHGSFSGWPLQPSGWGPGVGPTCWSFDRGLRAAGSSGAPADAAHALHRGPQQGRRQRSGGSRTGEGGLLPGSVMARTCGRPFRILGLTYLRFFLPSPTVQAEVSRARGRCRSLRPGFGLKTSRQLGHLRRGRHRALGSVPSAAVA